MRLIEELAATLDPTLQTGTFVGARLTPESEDRLLDWMKKTGIKNAEPRDKLHITIIGDKKKKFPWKSRKYGPLRIEPSTMFIDEFDEDEDDGVPLVLRFESPEIEARHDWAKKKYDIDWKFPEYNPHITLGYNTGVGPKDIPPPDFPIFVAGEYAQPWGYTIEDRAIPRPKWNKALYDLMHKTRVDG